MTTPTTGTVAVIPYVGDAALALTSATRTATELAPDPIPAAARRLDL